MQPEPTTQTQDWERVLGETLTRSRKAKKLTQAQLAQRAHVSLSALKDLEHGGGSSLASLIRVVLALGHGDWLAALEADQERFSPLDILQSAQSQNAHSPRSSRKEPAKEAAS